MSNDSNILLSIKKEIELKYKLKVAFLSFTGSKNYLLRTDLSDEDIICWVYPNTDTLISGEIIDKVHIKHKSNKVIYDLQIKDFRLLASYISSGNTLVFEQVFTEDIIIEDRLKGLFNKFKGYEYGLKIPIIRDLRSLAINHYNIIEKHDINGEDYCKDSSGYLYRKKYGYNTKSMSNILRIKYMFKEMLKGKKYSEVLILSSKDREDILSIKNGKLKFKDKDAISDYLINEIDFIDSYYLKLKSFYYDDYLLTNSKIKHDINELTSKYIKENNIVKGVDIIE